MEIKVCRDCGISKPVSEYHRAKKGKTKDIFKSRCKECENAFQRNKYHLLDKQEQIERRKRNPCNTYEWRKQHKLKTNYGLTLEEFSSMVEAQNNKCKICECDLENPQVDHDHKTGKVRGLLCQPCNTSLGLLKENPNNLYRMISYINDNLQENNLEELSFNGQPTNND